MITILLFQIVGEASIVCTENGFWSHPPPFCMTPSEIRNTDTIYLGNTTLVHVDEWKYMQMCVPLQQGGHIICKMLRTNSLPKRVRVFVSKSIYLRITNIQWIKGTIYVSKIRRPSIELVRKVTLLMRYMWRIPIWMLLTHEVIRRWVFRMVFDWFEYN